MTLTIRTLAIELSCIALILLSTQVVLVVSSTVSSSTVSFHNTNNPQIRMLSRHRRTDTTSRMLGTGNADETQDDDDEEDDEGDDEDGDYDEEGDDDDEGDDNNAYDEEDTAVDMEPTAEEVFRCTERGSMETPIYPLCPDGIPSTTSNDDGDDDDDTDAEADDDYGSETASDDAISYDKDCDAIRSGSEIVTDESDRQRTVQIDLALELDGNVADTLARLEAFLQTVIAADLTGCSNNDNNNNDAPPAVDLQYVLFDVTEDTKSKPYCDDCTNADVAADVRYNDGVDDSLIEGAIYDAFIARCDEMKEINGVVDTFDPCPTIVVRPINATTEPDTDGGGAVIETEPPIIDEPMPDDTNSTDRDGAAPVVEQTQASSNDRDITGAGIFGIVLLFLILLFFLIFCVYRRRRRAYERRRLAKLDQNDTFMMDDGNGLASGSPGRFSDGDDSMLDSRYGMYPEGQTEGMILGSRNMNQDVHKCSSATCNLCEARRQSNISFLPTSKTGSGGGGGILGIRPLQQVPTNVPLDPPSDVMNTSTINSSRTYGVDDTVIL